jgi:hypothetical protein
MWSEMPITLECREQRPQYAALSVNLAAFSGVNFPAGPLIRGWFDRGRDALARGDTDPFEGFIYQWFAVNGWAAFVTGDDRDTALVNALQADPAITEHFRHAIESDVAFRRIAEEFRGFLPVFKAQEVRRAELPLLREGNREEVVAYYLGRGMRQFEPRCAQRHIVTGEPIPVDWAHFLPAIYRVRCNLFHGDKMATSETDRRLVYLSASIIATVLTPFIARDAA